MRNETPERARTDFRPEGPSVEELGEVENDLSEILSSAENDYLYKMYISEMGPHVQKFNTFEEDVVLWERVKKGGNDGKEARDMLLFSVARFNVAQAAKRARGNEQLFMDLVSTGNLAILEDAVDKYNPFFGGGKIKFVTYAGWWIKKAHLATVYDESLPYRIPRQEHSDLRTVEKFTDLFVKWHGRKPSYEELSTITELSPKKVKRLMTIAEHVFIPLDKPKDDEESGNFTFEDIADENAVSRVTVEKRIEEKDEIDKVIKQIAALPPRAQLILRMRMGINMDDKMGPKSMTLAEVGKELGRSSEWIRQIQIQAIGKIVDPEVREHVRRLLVR